MEKRRFEQVSTRDGAEDEETRLKAQGDREGPKKPRRGGLEEAETGQDGGEKAEEEEVEDDPEGGGAQEEAKADGDLVEANGKESTLPVAVPRDDRAASRSEASSTAETPRPSRAEAPRSKTSEVSQTYAVLESFDALTGDTHRDKWLERLVQGIRYVCSSSQGDDGSEENGEEGSGAASSAPMGVGVGTSTASRDGDSHTGENLYWLDAAIPAITTLEKAVHETLASDFRKYNQKMRQLDFNLKNNAFLAKHLLKRELEPLVIINMTPNELKDGWAAAEKTNQEPQQSQYMTDVQCSRCMEKKVGVVEIIHAGGHGDRYQLECTACGHAWTALVDDISALTIDAPSAAGNVGAAPWATAKFEELEKKLLSPHELEKPAVELFQRATAPYVPVLEAHGLELHKPFERAKPQHGSEPAATTD